MAKFIKKPVIITEEYGNNELDISNLKYAIGEVNYLKRLGAISEEERESLLNTLKEYGTDGSIPPPRRLNALKMRISLQRKGQVMCLLNVYIYWMQLSKGVVTA